MNSIPSFPFSLRGTRRELAPFQFLRLRPDVLLLTNDLFSYAFLSTDEFDNWSRGGGLSDATAEYLEQTGFLRSVPEEIYASQHSDAFATARRYLFTPTSLFIFVLTLECDLNCVYCQASKLRDRNVDTWMDIDTAQKAVDFAFQSPASAITIEFQGGEPLLNWEVLKHVVEYAEATASTQGRELHLQITTNLRPMTDAIADFLVEHDIAVCTSCDGPKYLHNANRPTKDPMGSFAYVEKWSQILQCIYNRNGLDRQVSALATVTRGSLSHAKELVDTYAQMGFQRLFVRPVSPFGRGSAKQGYSPSDFISFYKEILSAVLDYAKKGHTIRDGFATILMKKILRKQSVNYMELRSPCGAGIGQLAIDWDGRVYSCDEGRMLAQSGDDAFLLGRVGDSSYRECVGQEIIQQMATASCIECHPDCAMCVFAPFCGVCPVYNLQLQGSLRGNMGKNEMCEIRKGIFSHLFLLLRDFRSSLLPVFEDWASS
jgi:uncharacterized protein